MRNVSQGFADVKVRLNQLTRGLSEGYSPGIPYDTAYLASHDRFFPKSLGWLLDNQKRDGSWGGEVEYLHDRVISTLASIVALSRNGNGERFKALVEKGEEYLNGHIDRVKLEKHSTIGFELLFPALVEEAQDLRLDVPDVSDSYFKEIRDEKLKLVLSDLIYTGKTTLSFSTEFLNGRFDTSKAHAIKNLNGSVGNSPSATAFFLQWTMDHDALGYLRRVYGLNGDGSIMAVYPFEVFEKSWACYNYIVLGLPVEEHILEQAVGIRRGWTDGGSGISWTSPVLDSDDTAVAFRVLSFVGDDPSPLVFEEYEQDNNFMCFRYERDPSISSNVHILDAIKNVDGYPRRDEAMEKIIGFLRSKMEPDGFWLDKWHLSPYYVTSHAIVALHGLEDGMVERSIDWILETQNPDGSWGACGGNQEETAYSLMALLFYHEKVGEIDEEATGDGLLYLSSRDQGERHPELWIAKGLYCPSNVVNSAILAVLYKSALMGLEPSDELEVEVVEAPEIATGGETP